MTFRRKAAAGAAGILAAVLLTGCSEAPGEDNTVTWCDHGNRLYSLDTEDTRGETLAVVPFDDLCPQGKDETEIRPEGDTRPMPEIQGVHKGPYVPYVPPVKPAPKPNPKPAPRPVAPPKTNNYRLSPEAR